MELKCISFIKKKRLLRPPLIKI